MMTLKSWRIAVKAIESNRQRCEVKARKFKDTAFGSYVAKKAAAHAQRLRELLNMVSLEDAEDVDHVTVDCACCGYHGLKNAYRVGDEWVGPECVNHYPLQRCRRKGV